MTCRELYLTLLKKALSDSIHRSTLVAELRDRGVVTVREAAPHEISKRQDGSDWPAMGETMIGMERLNNLQSCIEQVLEGGIPGDFIETGVWRGGATIFMRGILKAHDIVDRKVYVADSFEGLPPPDDKQFPVDKGFNLSTIKFLSVSLEEVKENFSRYGLLDEQVKFIKGWFRDTLSTLSECQWSVIRLDGDLYESTMEALEALYPRLSPGGFAIIDDYGCLVQCRTAVDDYRRKYGINNPIKKVDWTGVYWRKD